MLNPAYKKIFKIYINANKLPLFLGHYDAGKRICALNGLGKRCLNCFLINNDVECESKGCLWNVDVEENFHLCYFQPSPWYYLKIDCTCHPLKTNDISFYQ